MSEEKPKIIIDEDWKSQVEAEKAAAEADSQAGEDAPSATPDEPQAEAAQQGTEDDPAMPPASIDLLLSTLVTEAMMCLGAMPHPVTGETQPRRNQAKYLIDMIEVLRDKTKGNLEEAETQGIDSMLHQLRMVFVQMPK